MKKYLNLKLRTRLLNKKVILISSFIFIVFLSEFIFDIFEITLASLIEITNSVRPKSGTVWELYNQDQIANKRLSGITANITDKEKPLTITTLSELKSTLDEQGSVVISADQFFHLYNLLPTRSAQEIVAPLTLLKIYHSNKWVWMEITKEETSLRFIFLKGDNQPLLDSYPDLGVLYHVYLHEKTEQKSLESIPEFAGRTLSAEKFFNAFISLPDSRKLQLINNPFQLVKWYKNIRLVAISRYVKQHTVLIGFEIFNEIDNEVYTFQASELATNYLIARLNSLYPELNFNMPESKIDENIIP